MNQHDYRNGVLTARNLLLLVIAVMVIIGILARLGVLS